MLVSEKIKKAIKSEVKAQQNLMKLLIEQEKNYGKDLREEKEAIEASLVYYSKILKEE